MLTCGTQMVLSMESYFHVHCQHSTADHNHQPNARLSFPLEYEDDDFEFHNCLNSKGEIYNNNNIYYIVIYIHRQSFDIKPVLLACMVLVQTRICTISISECGNRPSRNCRPRHCSASEIPKKKNNSIALLSVDTMGTWHHIHTSSSRRLQETQTYYKKMKGRRGTSKGHNNNNTKFLKRRTKKQDKASALL